MTASLRIVAANPAYAPVIAEIHERSFDEAWSAAAVAALLASPGAFALLASGAAGPAAFILCRAAADECEVLALAVVPAARRAGIATALLGAASAEAFGRGARRMFLEVAEDNVAARGLYASHGFAEVGRRQGYYRAPSRTSGDALVLSRALAA